MLSDALKALQVEIHMFAISHSVQKNLLCYKRYHPSFYYYAIKCQKIDSDIYKIFFNLIGKSDSIDSDIYKITFNLIGKSDSKKQSCF